MNKTRNTAQKLAVGLSAGALLGLAIAGLLITLGLYAAPSGSIDSRTGTGPAVVELFTSQGCYSCPPAEQLLGELIENDPTLLALEFHVDYWDTLVYGKHGVHKDPYSDKKNTQRQQSYNQLKIEGQRGIFTPQIVINGRYATVGGREKEVRRGIQVVNRPNVLLNVAHHPEKDTDNKTGLSIQFTSDDAQTPATAHLWLAVFDIEKTTEINTGENHGKTLTSHHIVRQMAQLTDTRGIIQFITTPGSSSLEYQVEIKEGQGCAVLIQDDSLGPIYGASYCPKEIWKPSKSQPLS